MLWTRNWIHGLIKKKKKYNPNEQVWRSFVDNQCHKSTIVPNVCLFFFANFFSLAMIKCFVLFFFPGTIFVSLILFSLVWAIFSSNDCRFQITQLRMMVEKIIFIIFIQKSSYHHHHHSKMFFFACLFLPPVVKYALDLVKKKEKMKIKNWIHITYTHTHTLAHPHLCSVEKKGNR